MRKRMGSALSKLDVLVAVGIYGLAILGVLTFKLWLFGSLSVSTVKALSDSCNKTYPVEVYVVNGNWFCANE
jgi:hypothetical protein